LKYKGKCKLNAGRQAGRQAGLVKLQKIKIFYFIF
jgi:hypothetical protein